MRIWHLGKYYPPAPGGMETHLQTLAQAQARMGHEVRVLCMNHEKGQTITERENGVTVTRFHRSLSYAKLDYCPGLIATLKKAEADILHLHVPNPTMILAMLAAGPSIPTVVTYQSDVVRQQIRAWLFRPLEHFFYARVKSILASTHEYAQSSKFLRSYLDRVKVVPMGLALDAYLNPSQAHVQAAEAIRQEHAGPIWLCCSRLIYYKGLQVAIRAMRGVRGTLVIVGDGPERDSLCAQTEELGLQDRVKFMGQLSGRADIIPYYLAAEALFLPSNERSEAFGLVQIEAMASGCPVINTAIPGSGVTWVSKHEVSGLTIPRNDSDALAAAATRMTDEPGLRSKLSEGARRRASHEFTETVMTERVLAVYQSLHPATSLEQLTTTTHLG